MKKSYCLPIAGLSENTVTAMCDLMIADGAKGIETPATYGPWVDYAFVGVDADNCLVFHKKRCMYSDDNNPYYVDAEVLESTLTDLKQHLGVVEWIDYRASPPTESGYIVVKASWGEIAPVYFNGRNIEANYDEIESSNVIEWQPLTLPEA